MSENGKDVRHHPHPRFRISGITEGIPTLQVGEVLDLSLEGALVEHQGLLEPQHPCLLQLRLNGDLSTVRCRVVNNRLSRSRSGEGPSYQTKVEFLDLNPAATKLLKTLIRSLGGDGGCEAAGP